MSSVQLTRADQPRDCALAIAVPGFSKSATDTIASLGVTVARECTRAALGRLLRSHNVVVLVAPWLDGRLLPDDVADKRGFVHALLESGIAPLPAIRRNLSLTTLADLVSYLGGPAPVYFRERVLAPLNRVLATYACRTPLRGTSISEMSLLHANRLALASALPPRSLIRNSGIELSDQTLSAADVVSLLPRDHPGVLDLSVGHASVVADRARAAESGWCFLGADEAVEPARQVLLCEQVFEQMNHCPANYVRTMLTARTESLQAASAAKAHFWASRVSAAASSGRPVSL